MRSVLLAALAGACMCTPAAAQERRIWTAEAPVVAHAQPASFVVEALSEGEDRLWDGSLVGALAGVGGALLLAHTTFALNAGEETRYLILGAALGAMIGAAVDASMPGD
jgi:hypothetical protein